MGSVRRWSNVLAGTVATVAFVPIVSFRLALAAQGFRLMDLSGAGTIRPITSGAESFVVWGRSFAEWCFLLSVAALLSGTAVGVRGLVRLDPWDLIIAHVVVGLALVAGYLAFELGLIIAGV